MLVMIEDDETVPVLTACGLQLEWRDVEVVKFLNHPVALNCTEVTKWIVVIPDAGGGSGGKWRCRV